ncbi:calcium-binding protein [Nitrosomonas sp. Nm166]|uniref:calcium-binding protein n=1 Tax=Nitrosomonas sp. Nm166 TaxID=1881054 RepID=UPI0008F1A45D|nr:calcium-binding protein [Nitrosomonas sp. Nm166]SFE70637.1 EF hand [Nitrosomonas sp. Nm166]
MPDKRNSIVIATGAALLLTFSTTTVFATDAKDSSHQHQSGQATGHGDMKVDHHDHHKMSSVDQNKDGKISKEEFMKHHEAMFDKKDTNKDGFLDDTEIRHIHKHKQDQHKQGGHAPGDAKK